MPVVAHWSQSPSCWEEKNVCRKSYSYFKRDTVMHSYKSSTQEADAGQSQVLGLCGLKRKILPQIKQKKDRKKM